MSSTAPMDLGRQEVQDERGRMKEVAPKAATGSSTAAAAAEIQTQSQTQAHAEASTAAPPATATQEARQAANTSWVGIVFAVFALGTGLLLWTAIAVSGDYVRWIFSVGVMAVILAVTFVAIGYAYPERVSAPE